MTEKKRFKLGYVCGDFGLIDNDEWIDLHSMSENSEKNVQICINKMNELADENEQLQSEVNKLTDLLASEIEKNARLLQEINSLKIEDMRLKESIKDLNDVLARYEERELKE